MHRLILATLTLPLSALWAQSGSTFLRGTVRAGNQPVRSANVFVAGTTDGALTDSAGRFEFATNRARNYVVVVRSLGFREQRRTFAEPVDAILAFILEAEPHPIAPVSVLAGKYVASDESGAILTPLDIVTIPGTAADVNRAIQTLPGVQQVDEGTGLYVRGGDYLETRVFLNDALLVTPAQLQQPAGTFVGTFDPFLLDAVYFTSGGFGARYGDALSAVAALHTQGRPDAHSVSLSAGLAAVGVSAALAGPNGTGARFIIARSDLTPVLRLNGSPRAFSTPPRGRDLTASLHWGYRSTGRLALFSTTQNSTLAIRNETPTVADTFAVTRRDDAVVARWSDVFGRVAATTATSMSTAHGQEEFGSFILDSRTRLAQVSSSLDVSLTSSAAVRGGAEFTRHHATMSGSIPASGDDQRPGVRTRLYDFNDIGTRAALWSELDWRVGERGRVIVGLRRDDATRARRSTLDPRVSAAVRARASVSFTAAWGIYHQVVDPLLQALSDSAQPALPSMSAQHTIVGVQLGDSTPMLRVEVYDKTYRDLAGQTRDYLTVADGTGRAYGADVIARSPLVAGVATRVVYSFVRSRRTDPTTGSMAPAPADITHGIALIATRTFANGVSLGSAMRYSAGRPFTPVTGAVRDEAGLTWSPRYGAPGAERLPAFARLDLSASWFREVGAHSQIVGYLAITNLLDRPNVFTRRYSADYSSYAEVRSIFNRSLYFGAVLTMTNK